MRQQGISGYLNLPLQPRLSCSQASETSYTCPLMKKSKKKPKQIKELDHKEIQIVHVIIFIRLLLYGQTFAIVTCLVCLGYVCQRKMIWSYITSRVRCTHCCLLYTFILCNIYVYYNFTSLHSLVTAYIHPSLLVIVLEYEQSWWRFNEYQRWREQSQLFITN